MEPPSPIQNDDFDICRICLCEPESNSHVTFVSIFTTVLHPSQNLCLYNLMSELLGMNIDFNDVRPKIICENCCTSLVSWFEFKAKSAESEIVLDYIASKRFGGTRPGTSIASTSSPMLTNNDQSSQKSSFKHSRLQSNMFIASTSRSLFPSTSTMTLEDYDASTQPSTSSQTLFNSIDESTQASTSSLMLKNNTVSTFSSTFNHSQEKPQTSNAIGSNRYGCSSGVSNGSIIANGSNSAFVEESEDDCIEIIPPVVTVDLTLREESESENVDEGSSDNKESVVLNRHDENSELSSDSDNNKNFRNEDLNNETEKLYYCSICQKKKILNHDCSQHTKSFFTCLVPNCNILTRSKTHFTSHYQLHIGMSSSAVMCHHCFQEIKQCNIDSNGCHVRCNALNAFKCFTCNVKFDNMQTFAFHKLKTHNGLLMDAHGNYLCLHCENSSPELSIINDHMKNCLENQANKVTAVSKKPTKNETKLLPFEESNIKDVTVRKNGKISLTSEHVLFTCLKPNCNLIFQTFRIFKLHYRSHFNFGNTLVCWQCCKPFTNTACLRNHQLKYNCRIPGMFKCFECPNEFDDIESLSIHKFTYHNGNLMASKKNKKTIMCAFCQMHITIFNFKSHLATCKKKDGNKSTCTKNNKRSFNCLICKKVFYSSVSLSNHSRIHNRARVIANVKKE